MKQLYSLALLAELHNELYAILAKIVEVCDKHNIQYFVIGGTLIGAMYDHSILPWDDDIDIGMTRDNYNKFLKVAPEALGGDYFLSYIESDYHTPFFYAKVKKNNTLFVEEKFQNINMHHGIFVDIFPFDKVPNQKYLRKIQYKIVNFLKTCLMGKEVWMWKYFRKCEIQVPLQRSFFSTLLCWGIVSLFSKKQIYQMMLFCMTLYDHWNTSHVGLIVTLVDYFRVTNLSELQSLSFGPLKVKAASNLDEYLKYNSLRRFTEEDLLKHVSHQPLILKLSKNGDPNSICIRS